MAWNRKHLFLCLVNAVVSMGRRNTQLVLHRPVELAAVTGHQVNFPATNRANLALSSVKQANSPAKRTRLNRTHRQGLSKTRAANLFPNKGEDRSHLSERESGCSGLGESIHFVGNVMVDSLMRFLPAAQKSPIGHDLGVKLGEKWGRFGILTLHRPSNVASPGKLISLLRAVEALATKLPIIFPAHPRTREHLTQSGVALHHEVLLVPPLGYLDFICLLSNASLVLTDSGGIQDETTAFGVPCLTLRENTERPVTITKGTNTLVGTDPDKILGAAHEILDGGKKLSQVPPLWDGRAAYRIVQILSHSAPHDEVSAATKY
jgi:UDP-N-acetylglucosamine 2-epimerase